MDRIEIASSMISEDDHFIKKPDNIIKEFKTMPTIQTVHNAGPLILSCMYLIRKMPATSASLYKCIISPYVKPFGITLAKISDQAVAFIFLIDRCQLNWTDTENVSCTDSNRKDVEFAKRRFYSVYGCRGKPAASVGMNWVKVRNERSLTWVDLFLYSWLE